MTQAEAIKIHDTKWWKSKNISPLDIVAFQIFEERLCMPFDEFQTAVQQFMGYPVFTHQFADTNFINSVKSKVMEKINPQITQQWVHRLAGVCGYEK